MLKNIVTIAYDFVDQNIIGIGNLERMHLDKMLLFLIRYVSGKV